ncbi:hypothetical protein GmRootV35_29640 [Variovorax sp. V35]
MGEGKLPKRQYKGEFKAQAVKLAASVGGHEAARRLGVPVATLGNWSRRGIASAGASDAAVSGEAPARRLISEREAENIRLRRELADVKLDVEILRKVTSYFARGRDEVRLDRRASQPVRRQPALPSPGRVSQRLLPMARAPAQPQHTGQPGSGRQGGSHP